MPSNNEKPHIRTSGTMIPGVDLIRDITHALEKGRSLIVVEMMSDEEYDNYCEYPILVAAKLDDTHLIVVHAK